MSGGGRNLTSLFGRMRHGDAEAVNGVMSPWHTELHRLAAHHMRGDARRHTLQPRALANEAYLRLMHGLPIIHDRQHFLALVAQAMRRVLVTLPFFGGHTDQEVCEILGEKLPTVRRGQVFARCRLKTRLQPTPCA